MAERSDAFCALPGGLDTLDETFEIITWRQLKLHDKPVILVNLDGYWDPLLRLVEHQTAAGYLRGGSSGLFHVVERVDQVLEAAAKAPRPTLPDKIERLSAKFRQGRSEERRVGKGGVGSGRPRWSPYHEKQNRLNNKK